MLSLNRAQLIGNAGKDPEVRYTANGLCVATLSLATTEKAKDNGEETQVTEWHRLVAFGKVAEFISEHVKKGTKCFVEGKLKTNKYKDKQGIDRYMTQIHVIAIYALIGVEKKESDESNMPNLIDDLPF